MKEARSELELYLLDYLIGKNAGNRLFHIESLRGKFNVSLDILTNTLKQLQQEGVITFIGGNHIKVNPDFKDSIQDIIDIYGLVEGLPYYKIEFVYFNTPRLEITIPFKSRFEDKIDFDVVKKQDNLYLQKSPYKLILLFDKYLPEDYVNELRWRFRIDIGFDTTETSKGEIVEIPYFRKKTNPETFVKDLYQMINAWLFIEGYLAKDTFKPVSKEELIETIVDMVGQGIYDGYVSLAFQGKFPKTEVEIDEEIEAEMENLYKQLQDKPDEELWQILEEKAREIIPVINGKIDSSALSAYRDALMLLARKGKFEIEYKGGRRIIGKWR